MVVVVVAVLVFGLLVLAALVDRKDKRARRLGRDATEMWQGTMREQTRDMRASHAVHNIYNPDLSQTEWGKRNKQS